MGFPDGSDGKESYLSSTFCLLVHLLFICMCGRYLIIFSFSHRDNQLSHFPFFGQYVSPPLNFTATSVVCFLNKCIGMFLSSLFLDLFIYQYAASAVRFQLLVAF